MFGIFLGAMCELFYVWEWEVIQCEELKTFLYMYAITFNNHTYFDRECQVAFRVYSHYNPQPYTLFRLVIR